VSFGIEKFVSVENEPCHFLCQRLGGCLDPKEKYSVDGINFRDSLRLDGRNLY
jgi:hypothetical protein